MVCNAMRRAVRRWRSTCRFTTAATGGPLVFGIVVDFIARSFPSVLYPILSSLFVREND